MAVSKSSDDKGRTLTPLMSKSTQKLTDAQNSDSPCEHCGLARPCSCAILKRPLLQKQVNRAATNRGPAPDEHANADEIINDRYRIVELIGRGGMGSVYKVKDELTNTELALKMITPQLLAERAVMAKRLEKEARTAKLLEHPNIVAIRDIGRSESGVPYLVMDLIDGTGFEELIQSDTPLSQARMLKIFVQVALALQHAHEKGIVHRDLKPGNMLLTISADGEETVKIVDFGIAKIIDDDDLGRTRLTQAGELIGSPFYMSPEQGQGLAVDGRSDIYSFGCIMYEVLAGRVPFYGENALGILLKHISDEPEALPKDSGIADDLSQIVMRCLEKEPLDRYSTVDDLLRDLQLVQAGKPVAVQPKKKTRLKAISVANFNRYAYILAATLALSAIALLVFYHILSSH